MATRPWRFAGGTQESVVATFYKLFPADWFSRFRFPMIEDLINQAPFISCLQGLGMGWSIEPVVRGWSDQTSSTATSRELESPCFSTTSVALWFGPLRPLASWGITLCQQSTLRFWTQTSSARHTCMRGLSVLCFHGGHELQRHVM